ncbi:MAG: bifunctional 5,10-methylenetetrahydrofolate dehydrogenase/5,10-methenyltetrahydrofolate cyclohydrolase [Planctomycetota bacterium]|nr:MAG: bifunctional 5,10-methylenetetrahydrofolate dehydrogenase/5,10-methenyltetrahydrofolate cyclohydrolase [Planctomycetota bacterium]
MAAKTLYGKSLAQKIKGEVKKKLGELKKLGKLPYLVSLQVGENPSSSLYLERQKKSCQKMGIAYADYHLDPKTPYEFLVHEVKQLNKNPHVTGILLQMPIPKHLDPKPIYSLIHPAKDVEGMHPENLGCLALGRPNLVPCTAMAVFELIKSTGISLEGKEAVIVGHSEIVGKPISLLLLSSMVTTTTCHIATKDLKEHTSKADILIVAAGVPNLIHKDMVKPGAIVVDVGINLVEVEEKDAKIKKTVGDIAPDVAEVASYITPVPGGVGPVTVAMLLRNTVEAVFLSLDRDTESL